MPSFKIKIVMSLDEFQDLMFVLHDYMAWAS